MARGSSSYTARSIRRRVSEQCEPDPLVQRADDAAMVFRVIASSVVSGKAVSRTVRANDAVAAIAVVMDADAADISRFMRGERFTRVTVERMPDASAVDETDEQALARRRHWVQTYGPGVPPCFS